MTPATASGRLGAGLLAAAVLASSACSAPAPADAQGAGAVRHEIENQGNGLIQLVRFTRTGGRTVAFLGVTSYVMDYSADIAFLNDACYGGGLSAHPYLPPRYDRSGMPARDAPGACFRVHVSRGEHREVTGTLPFERTAAGAWRGPDGRMY